jgi:hypothetical protein
VNEIKAYPEERLQSRFEELMRMDFDLWNSIFKQIQKDMTAIALAMLNVKVRAPRDSTNTSRDARFAARFGSPPRIEIRCAKLNPYEAREHGQSVADVFSELAGSILKRSLTENERYGNTLIPESKAGV